MGAVGDRGNNRIRARLRGPAVGAVGYQKRQAAVSEPVHGGCVWLIWLGIGAALAYLLVTEQWGAVAAVVGLLALARMV